MPRILGVNIPLKKRIIISLTYIYGIGLSLSRKIIQQHVLGHTKAKKHLTIEEKKILNLFLDRRTQDISPEEISCLTKIIQQFQNPPEKTTDPVLLEGDLRKEIAMNIKNQMEIVSYRGIRHRQNLPTRGQRTRSNARTRKGPRKTVANKKMESKH